MMCECKAVQVRDRSLRDRWIFAGGGCNSTALAYVTDGRRSGAVEQGGNISLHGGADHQAAEIIEPAVRS